MLPPHHPYPRLGATRTTHIHAWELLALYATPYTGPNYSGKKILALIFFIKHSPAFLACALSPSQVGQLYTGRKSRLAVAASIAAADAGAEPSDADSAEPALEPPPNPDVAALQERVRLQKSLAET